MLIKAKQKFIRLSPRKIRLVADSIRHLSLAEALEQLQVLNKRAALPLKKTLRQAIANAVNNHGLDEKKLCLKEIQINEGPTYKRWQPVSRGRAHSIMKRTSHIRIILESPEKPKIEKSKTIKTKKQK